jgi:hypothetical protein
MLSVAAWIYFALAALNVPVYIDTGAPIFVAAAISLATVGLLLLALDRIIVLLADIRQGLRGAASGEQDPADEAGAKPTRETRSLASLSEDIKRLRERS